VQEGNRGDRAATETTGSRCHGVSQQGGLAAMSDHANSTPQDPNEQIAQLREQVQSLMNERVGPALSQAADTAKQYTDQAKQYASEARDIYEDQAAVLSERVRESPVMAVLVAAGVGYILGRIAR